MPISSLDMEGTFPPTREAEPDGLLAFGGDTSPERLLEAYRLGIFPWYNEEHPILWWAPPERCVMRPHEFHVPKSLKPRINQGTYDVRMDTAFLQVLEGCQTVGQNREAGTWLNDELKDSCLRLHELGFAHSVEAWDGEHLVGGLYGVSLGGMFFGESMFSSHPNASKVALAYLCAHAPVWGFTVIDCQVASPHLVSLGAREIARADFVELVEQGMRAGIRTEPWQTRLCPCWPGGNRAAR